MPINDDKKIKSILESTKIIAVVGASQKPSRDSYRIFLYLKNSGYTVIPVNPIYQDIDGTQCYPDLKSIKDKIDIVNIFRNPDEVMEIIEEAVLIKAKTVWMQLGVVNNIAADYAKKSGLNVIMDRCIAVEHSRLIK